MIIALFLWWCAVNSSILHACIRWRLYLGVLWYKVVRFIPCFVMVGWMQVFRFTPLYPIVHFVRISAQLRTNFVSTSNELHLNFERTSAQLGTNFDPTWNELRANFVRSSRSTNFAWKHNFCGYRISLQEWPKSWWWMHAGISHPLNTQHLVHVSNVEYNFGRLMATNGAIMA